MKLTRKNLLALDMATQTGWATADECGTWDFKIFPDESHGMRLIRFRSKLREICDSLPIRVIAFESVNVSQGAKANLNGVKIGVSLQSTLQLFCEDPDSPIETECLGVNLQTIKSFAGVRKKEDLMLTAARELGREIEDDNQADACWLFEYACDRLSLGSGPHMRPNAIGQ